MDRDLQVCWAKEILLYESEIGVLTSGHLRAGCFLQALGEPPMKTDRGRMSLVHFLTRRNGRTLFD